MVILITGSIFESGGFQCAQFPEQLRSLLYTSVQRERPLTWPLACPAPYCILVPLDDSKDFFLKNLTHLKDKDREKSWMIFCCFVKQVN